MNHTIVENSHMHSDASTHTIEFRGTVNEYFGIWIVNVLLTIVTFGIYSAWAKVRNKKFFYGQTFIDDHNFDYHATGLQIFIGRLIFFIVYIIFVLSSVLSIALYGLLLVLLMAALGWIIARAIRFNARVSSYRNVRFDFTGNSLGAWLRYILYPLLIYFGFGTIIAIVSFIPNYIDTSQSVSIVIGIMTFLGFIAVLFTIPILSRSINRYQINNYRFGDRSFSFDSNIRPYYKAFLIMTGLIAACVIVFSFIMFLASIIAQTNLNWDDSSESFGLFISIFYPLFLFTFFAAGIVYRVAIRNIIFNNAVLDEKHSFISSIRTLPYTWIIISNIFLIIITVGLMVPWARVRLAKYVANNTQVIIQGDLKDYASSVIETHGVTASEFADIEGFDIDIGI